MQQQASGGSIVMIGSVSGVRPSPGTAAYGAAKAGLHHLAVSLAVEWAPKVRVNSVVAGMVMTEQANDHYGDPAGMAAAAATVPLQRMATPDDVAGACLFLASPMASYVSGAACSCTAAASARPFWPRWTVRCRFPGNRTRSSRGVGSRWLHPSSRIATRSGSPTACC